MIIQAAQLSFANVFAQRSRSLMLKTLGATILSLIGIWFGFNEIITAYLAPFLGDMLPDLPSWLGFLTTFFFIFAGVSIALVLALLIAPITAIVAGFFIDAIADDIEERKYPSDPKGKPMGTMESVIHSLKFLAIVLLGNLFALMLLFVPGVNMVAFFLVNGYLLGREYFEFAALRHHEKNVAKALRSKYAGQIFLAGLVIAGFLSVPLLNLLTPFFAAGLMVHLHKMVVHKEANAGPI